MKTSGHAKGIGPAGFGNRRRVFAARHPARRRTRTTPMSQSSDEWYVRFPDGRVIHAHSTASVRHHLETGTIPPESRVRRAAGEEWTLLEWTTEFADLA